MWNYFFSFSSPSLVIESQKIIKPTQKKIVQKFILGKLAGPPPHLPPYDQNDPQSIAVLGIIAKEHHLVLTKNKDKVKQS